MIVEEGVYLTLFNLVVNEAIDYIQTLQHFFLHQLLDLNIFLKEADRYRAHIARTVSSDYIDAMIALI